MLVVLQSQPTAHHSRTWRPPTSCRWCFNFSLRHHFGAYLETTDFTSVVLQFQPTRTLIKKLPETPNFMLVELQFQPTRTLIKKLPETTNFMLVELQFQPTASLRRILRDHRLHVGELQFQPTPQIPPNLLVKYYYPHYESSLQGSRSGLSASLLPLFQNPLSKTVARN
jgi:hypothetical protein